MFPIVRGAEHSMNDYQLKNLERITFNSRIMAGQACIRGMRIPVSLVVNLVANGKPFDEILSEYPDLELDDLKQSLQYAALLTRETVYPFPTTA
ncbi:MAG: DUF433 domain-containing protein [Cyanobacteria bacterium J06629_2]